MAEQEGARAPTVWIDTNVMVEVYSHGDMFEAETLGLPLTFEERRRRMQGTLWMTMALAARGVTTVTYQHENVRNLLRLGAPGTGEGHWTRLVIYLLGDGGVFDGWDRKMTNVGADLNNPARDRLMVENSRDDGLILITRDAGAAKRADAKGVLAMKPEKYAATVMPRATAREMFMARLYHAAESYPSRYPAYERKGREREAQAVVDAYQRIWQPPIGTTAPTLLTLPRATAAGAARSRASPRRWPRGGSR